MDGSAGGRETRWSRRSIARSAALALALALLATPALAQPDTPTRAPAATAETVSPAAEPLQPSVAPVVPALAVDPAVPALPRDLSPLGMFLAADAVVKAVIVGLAIASVLTWAMAFVKAVELAGARRHAGRALRAVLAAPNLDAARRALRGRADPGAAIVAAAVGEAALSSAALAHAGGEGLKERAVSAIGRIEASAARRMARGTGLLASIGATAPFIGLFGTVWGIMNAFIGISEAETTNLAVVAPGIAEALLATAMGLGAAIPAVLIYNHFARALAGYRLLLGDVAAATLRLVSRDLDFRRIPTAAAVPRAAE